VLNLKKNLFGIELFTTFAGESYDKIMKPEYFLIAILAAVMVGIVYNLIAYHRDKAEASR